jgi:hypothetical protein
VQRRVPSVLLLLLLLQAYRSYYRWCSHCCALHITHMHCAVLYLLRFTLSMQDLCPLPNYFAPVRLEALASAMALNNKINKEVDEERTAARGNNNGSQSNGGSDDEEDDDGKCKRIKLILYI